MVEKMSHTGICYQKQFKLQYVLMFWNMLQKMFGLWEIRDLPQS